MKKFGLILLSIILLTSICLVGCEKSAKTYSIIFRQVGYDDKVVVVNIGEKIADNDIPEPIQNKGDDISVEWDVDDFSKITSTTTVKTKDVNIYSLVFRQEGRDDVVKKVKHGCALTDIPSPYQPSTEYTLKWNKTDFSCITSNAIIEVVDTYKIYFDVKGNNLNGYVKDTQGIAYDSNSQLYYITVKVGKTFSLFTPDTRNDDYDFSKWVIKGTKTQFVAGTYNLTEDTYLTAVWSLTSSPLY